MRSAHAVILTLLAAIKRPTPATKLVKLVYFVDYIYFKHYGRTLTGFQYQWDHFGPNALGHAIVTETENLVLKDEVKVILERNIYGGTTEKFSQVPGTVIPWLSLEAEMVVQDVIQQYAHLSVQSIIAKSKQTAPFKDAVQYQLLTMEQSAPVGQTKEGDWDAYQRDLKESGTLSLQEAKSRYGLA